MRNREMKKQSGFTLVEFIVAMGVTVVILTGATLAFKDTVRANQHVVMHEDMNENMRSGLNLMEQDFIQAGTGIPTGGIIIPATSDGNVNNPCNVGAPISRPAPTPSLVNTSSTGLIFNSFNTCSFTLPAIEPGPDLGPLVTSPDASSSIASDIITVLYADNTLSLNQQPINLPASNNPPNPGCAGSITPSGDAVTFDSACVNFAKAGIIVTPGDLILFYNTLGYALQAVTSVNGQTLSFSAGDPYHLNQRNDPAGTIHNIQNADGTFLYTTATRVWMVSYYLDNTTDPSHVRLVRRVNFQPGQPVGETLENLQFLYNYKDATAKPPTRQPGVPNGFSENQIRSVNVYVAARSTYVDPSTSKYMRDSLMTQVSFRSMAFVNRYK
jgi:prepilin-type N-terminal cleavage/methylation domain-containing protein